jgi:hypothetical protein
LKILQSQHGEDLHCRDHISSGVTVVTQNQFNLAQYENNSSAINTTVNYGVIDHLIRVINFHNARRVWHHHQLQRFANNLYSTQKDASSRLMDMLCTWVVLGKFFTIVNKLMQPSDSNFSSVIYLRFQFFFCVDINEDLCIFFDAQKSHQWRYRCPR